MWTFLSRFWIYLGDHRKGVFHVFLKINLWHSHLWSYLSFKREGVGAGGRKLDSRVARKQECRFCFLPPSLLGQQGPAPWPLTKSRTWTPSPHLGWLCPPIYASRCWLILPYHSISNPSHLQRPKIQTMSPTVWCFQPITWKPGGWVCARVCVMQRQATSCTISNSITSSAYNKQGLTTDGYNDQ